MNWSMQMQSAKGQTVKQTGESKKEIKLERLNADLLGFSCELNFTVSRSLQSQHCMLV